jgi:putative aldouronate transport system permease protein
MNHGSRYIWSRKILPRWQLYLMMLPAVLYLLLFVYKPMYGVIIAFKDYKLSLGIWGSEWIGFDNFTRLFRSYWFPIILKNTITISLLGLFIGFPVGPILALMVNEIQTPWAKKTFQTVSYAPHFISMVVMCGMVILFLSPSGGIVNLMLNALGIESVFFMQKPEMFKWIYTLSGIWQNMGWSAIIYYAALSGVDKQVVEAAKIDGANRMHIIRHVNLPVLVPTMIILFILRCGTLLSVGYEKVYLLQNSTNLVGSEVISTYVYKVGLENKDFSFSTATGLFNSLINVIILVTVNRIAKRISENSLW